MIMGELLSRQFLKSIGVELDEETYLALSKHYEDTLDDRLVQAIIEELDENQLEELSRLRGTSGQLLQEWLAVNVPKFDEIIEGEVAILMGDIAESADSI